MLAEIVPRAYDLAGLPTSQPTRRIARCLHPTLPIGRYLTDRIGVCCRDLDEVRAFLRTCRYVSDIAQFGTDDYWQLPGAFEGRRTGDCEDFALWTWRQLIALGHDCRFVVGAAGRYGIGHAWLTVTIDGRHYLLEPLLSRIGPSFPRLSTLRYRPEVSLAWDGSRLTYFKHQRQPFDLTLAQVLVLLPEWLRFWSVLWLRIAWRLPAVMARRVFGRFHPAAPAG